MGSPEDVVAELLERCREDHKRWINGDASGYLLPEGGTILGAIGGWNFGGADTAKRQGAVAGQWISGTGDLEPISSYVADGLAVLVFTERATVRFAAEPEIERRWDLRVTEVFQFADESWVRVHRHADPLVDRRPVAEIVALVR